jgi:hypothetical protein
MGWHLLALDDAADCIFREFDNSFTSIEDAPKMTTVIDSSVLGIRKRLLAFIGNGRIV